MPRTQPCQKEFTFGVLMLPLTFLVSTVTTRSHSVSDWAPENPVTSFMGSRPLVPPETVLLTVFCCIHCPQLVPTPPPPPDPVLPCFFLGEAALPALLWALPLHARLACSAHASVLRTDTGAENPVLTPAPPFSTQPRPP